MNVWYHLSTIFSWRLLAVNGRRALRLVGLLSLTIALITTLLFAIVTRVSAAENQVIGFQGRLLDSTGNIVPDGYYNIQFKIYQDGTGTAAGNPGGTLEWTETYINNGNATGAVQVTNGLLSVNLGSITPFGSSVDWNEGTLWLSMNVAGRATDCTTFGSGSCDDDGEMLPMKRLTASPFAMNAGAVDGKTSQQLVQLAQGVQVDASTNTSSIFINKTGSGNLLQLQNTATDIFTINNTGSISFGSNANQNISIDISAPDSAGRQLSIAAGAGGSGDGSNGGTLNLQGGAAGGTNGNGGDIIINGGAKTGTGTDGAIAIGTANTSSITIGGGSGDVVIGSNDLALNGDTTIQGKNSVTIKTDGTTQATFSDTDNTVYFGNGITAAAPNDYTLQGTGSSTTGVNGGSLSIQGGNATTGNADGGNVNISGGNGSGTGTDGVVVIDTPTFSTVEDDANCYTSGTLVATSCVITANSVNTASVIIAGFSETDQTATLPDPSNTTAGRLMYVTAAGDSEDFTLLINGGGNGNRVAMRANSTTALLWNGADWTITSASASSLMNLYTGAATDALNIQIGGDENSPTTLLTLDQAGTAPTVADSEALLGSMYYDTTLGKVQCYEADGWGACSDAPDTFISLSPEYSNAVTNGSNLGTMTTDFCSDTLNINDAGAGVPVCGTNETYNFYNWTSAEVTEQTKSIYVTYQLPSNFKNFVGDSLSLKGRTDSADASVNYQLYRNDGTNGLVACGTAVAVSTGAQTTWQEGASTGLNDPSGCSFAAGESIVIRINLSAANDANAYVSNLGFAFSNN